MAGVESSSTSLLRPRSLVGMAVVGSWRGWMLLAVAEVARLEAARVVGAMALGCKGCHRPSTLCMRSGTWTRCVLLELPLPPGET
jgi:hypothetical protein